MDGSLAKAAALARSRLFGGERYTAHAFDAARRMT
jgi:hypothetical protein